MYNVKYQVIVDGINCGDAFKIGLVEKNLMGSVLVATSADEKSNELYILVDSRFLKMGNLEQRARIFSGLCAADKSDAIKTVFGIDIYDIDSEVMKALDELTKLDDELTFFTPGAIYRAAEVAAVFGMKTALKILKVDYKSERKVAKKVIEKAGYAIKPAKIKKEKSTKVANKAALRDFKKDKKNKEPIATAQIIDLNTAAASI